MKRNFNCMKILFILTITIFTLSCKNKKEKEQEQVTTTEAKDFARQLQISIEKKDATFFDNAIDKETFLQKIGLNKAGFRKESRGLHYNTDYPEIRAIVLTIVDD